MGDAATFVTLNRIRPAAAHGGSFPRTCGSVDWPRLLDPDLAQQSSRRDRWTAGLLLFEPCVADPSGSVVHVSPRTRNADPLARIGAQSAPGSPAIIRHAELQSPETPFSFPNACTTNPQRRQRIGHALRWVHPARIRVRPTLRSRGVRTPLPLSAAQTRPGGSREAARRPDGTTTMGRARVPGAYRRGISPK
jgi:hypothetical protein